MPVREVSPVLTPDVEKFGKELSGLCVDSDNIALHMLLNKFPGALF